jgi:hypothetical protein
MPQKKQDTSKTPAKRTSKQQKEGGNLVTDVKNLAVPFAILLAKEGLTKYFHDNKESKTTKTSAKTSAKSSTASSSKSLSRRKTLTGGSCNLGCGGMTGGASKQLIALQQQIDNFLEKY